MPLDLSRVKAELAKAQSKGKTTKFEKTDFTKVYWKPKLGSQTIRIVPSKYNKEWPFQQVTTHRDIVVKQMYALTNWGEKDPIMEFVAALKAEAAKKKAAGQNSDEEWNLAKKLSPKTRTFVQVVVRGEEHLGTRLWEFGNEVYEQLLKLANNPEYSDFTDIHDGTDLTVEGFDSEFNGVKYVKPSITPKRNSSPLTKDSALLEKLLNEQYDPLGLFKKYTYDEIHANLSKWLQPDQEQTTEMSVEQPVVENIDDLPFDPDPVEELVEQPASVKEAVSKKTTEIKKEAKKTEKPLIKTETKPKSGRVKFDNLFKEDGK